MLNHIVIMGRFTRDPELRYTQSNTPVASFTLAVERDVAGDSGTRETDFIDCVAWRQTAEFVNKYFSKGSMAVASGRLQLRDWTDRNGDKRRSAEILTNHVYFGESKKSDNISVPQSQTKTEYHYQPQRNAGYGHSTSAFAELEEDDGNLPF